MLVMKVDFGNEGEAWNETSENIAHPLSTEAYPLSWQSLLPISY